MKELYTAPEVKLIGFVADKKIAADSDWDLDFGDWGITLNSGSTNPASSDIKIPING